MSDPLLTLSEDVGSLWCGKIRTIESPPSSFEFLRDFVSPSLPCIIRGAIKSTTPPNGNTSAENPLLLTLDDIMVLLEAQRSKSDEEVILTVDVTPDGHGDCVRTAVHDSDNHEMNHTSKKRLFVKPEQRRMTLKDFSTQLRQGQSHNSPTLRRSSEAKQDAHCQLLTSYPLLQKLTDKSSKEKIASDTYTSTSPSDFSSHPVLYYSMQNDCLRTELHSLFKLNILPRELPFAQEAFNTGPPDAINLWIGDERSVSSMHKDHYENLFYVLSGEKVFTLTPPADLPFLYEDEFEEGTFQFVKKNDNMNTNAIATTEMGLNSTGYWGIMPDDNANNLASATTPSHKARWIEPDITCFLKGDHRTKAQFPLLSHAHPIEVRVKAGEMLYLPSLWFHRVTQTCETVGINWWYDMKFDSKWCYFNLLQNISSTT